MAAAFPLPNPVSLGSQEVGPGSSVWFSKIYMHAGGTSGPIDQASFWGWGVCVWGSLLCCCLLLSHEEDSSDQLLCVLTSKLLTEEGSMQSQAPSQISKAVCVQMLVSQVTKIQYWATLKCFIPKIWEIHIQRRRGLPRGTAFTNMTNMQWIQV